MVRPQYGGAITQVRVFLFIFSFLSFILAHPSPSMPWFGGWTKDTKAGLVRGMILLDAINVITPPVPPYAMPLRMTVQDVYRIGGIGTVIVGRIETGVIVGRDGW
jgi:elongation factor 1-alpha